MPKEDAFSKSTSLWSSTLHWIHERFLGATDTEHAFGEESILSQADPTPVCPRTGKNIHEEPTDSSCCLRDGSCSDWAAMDFKVRCLKLPPEGASTKDPDPSDK